MTDDNGDARVYDQHGKYLGRSSGGQMPDGCPALVLTAGGGFLR